MDGEKLSRTIELLAPARNLEAGRAAIDCGADAVYIGGPAFGARHAADNSVEDIASLARYAHGFGARVYVTMNTVLFDDELAEAECVARQLVTVGVDALIVQDMAFLRMGSGGLASKIPLHASTQTANAEPDQITFLGRAGFARVILERALSLDEIRTIRAATASTGVELEAFVHGAICVGYSGRCFMSRAASKVDGDDVKSGNRGTCSQPCRLAWDLTDGAGETIIEGKHLLSVRDLDLGARLGELIDAGVTSLKIEGRLKDVAYVRNIVGHYRCLLDEVISQRNGLRRASVGRSELDFVPDPGKSFTRGASEFFVDGRRRGVASFDTPKSIGSSLGRVAKIGHERTGNGYFTLENADAKASSGAKVSAGDGICFFAGGALEGTSINRMEANRIYPNKLDGIVVGTEIFLNYDHAFTRALERSRTRRRIEVTAAVATGPTKIEIIYTDETGISATATREGHFDEAKNSLKMAATLGEEISRSGDTIFDVCTVDGPGRFFVPVSTIAALRREGLQRLAEIRLASHRPESPAAEDPAAKFTRTTLAADANVTNRLATAFWRDHGVTEFAPPLELNPIKAGDVVMRTRYCIRRETGRCLKNQQTDAAELFLERGHTRWRLGFDCARCEMTILRP